MKLSVPIYRLRRQARLLSRAQGIPLHAALDRIAAGQGVRSWGLLAARHAAASPASSPAARIYPQLQPGDLLLVGARPGQGKTLLSLELAVEAMKAGHRATLFSLEDTARDLPGRFDAIGADPARFADRFAFDDSDRIGGAHVVARLADAPAGSLAVIDYLQLLDQRRDSPDLMDQVRQLRGFAEARGQVLVFISQIDRAYDPDRRDCPGLDDVRLPNPLDLGLFGKTCFLHDGQVRFDHVGGRA